MEGEAIVPGERDGGTAAAVVSCTAKHFGKIPTVPLQRPSSHSSFTVEREEQVMGLRTGEAKPVADSAKGKQKGSRAVLIIVEESGRSISLHEVGEICACRHFLLLCIY